MSVNRLSSSYQLISGYSRALSPGDAQVHVALDVATSCLPKLRADRLTEEALSTDPLRRVIPGDGRVHLVAVGKAAPHMAVVVRSAVGPKRFAGGICVAAGPAPALPGIHTVWGDHPVPGARSFAAGRAVQNFLRRQRFGASDVVVFAVSGGGSALISAPSAPVSLADLGLLTTSLLRSGLEVTQINRLRELLSEVHGGALLHLTHPAQVVGLILCDNVQDGPSAVASGLSYPSRADTATARQVLEKARLPSATHGRISEALRRRPKADTSRSVPVNVTIGDPGRSVDACAEAAERHGYRVIRLGDRVQGEAREVAAELGRLARTQYAGRTVEPVCLIAAGEVTVSVRGTGRGGRCQELAWAVAGEIAGLPTCAFVALSTDGQDFLPGVMGGYVSGDTLAQATARGIDWRETLENNDSHTALRALGRCIPGRRTGTNLCDVYVMCCGLPSQSRDKRR